ncbi:CCHC-type domain-containing protein [Trichonephila clavipes]|nr:CCHC-type domain-containing protein [Trichonephila clavipes]
MEEPIDLPRERLGKTLSNGLKVRSVANFNKWDDMMCLANVYFFLDETARQWKYRAPVQKFPPEPRKTDVWRTADNRPVCFHCGRPGHVMRYCRERKAVFDNSRNRRRNFDDVGTEEEIRRPNSSRRFTPSPTRPIPNTSLQIPVAISPIQSVARP